MWHLGGGVQAQIVASEVTIRVGEERWNEAAPQEIS
jgi:hypothetical protein